MSRQSTAKATQGYVDKAHGCGDCARRAFDLVLPAWMQQINIAIAEGRRLDQPYSDLQRVEVSQHCSIGGFAVKKGGICGRHEVKAVE